MQNFKRIIISILICKIGGLTRRLDAILEIPGYGCTEIEVNEKAELFKRFRASLSSRFSPPPVTINFRNVKEKISAANPVLNYSGRNNNISYESNVTGGHKEEEVVDWLQHYEGEGSKY